MIIQPTFHVPPDILAGILSGDFIRHGGVVRDTAGRLVTHLKEIPTSDGRAAEKAKRVAVSLKNPWVVVGVGMLTLVAVGGGVVLALKKRKTDAKPDVPECVQNYTESLCAYLDAIQNGNLDKAIIGRLISDLDAVVAYGGVGETTVAFSQDQVTTLTKVVLEYTTQLATANNVNLAATGTPHESTEGETVVDLRRYLELQRRIFDEAV